MPRRLLCRGGAGAYAKAVKGGTASRRRGGEACRGRGRQGADLRPHPDDESLTGALPLRLARESGGEVAVVAVTLGSDPARKEGRLGELAAAVALLGWEWLLAEEPLALDDINLAARRRDEARWQRQVEGLASLFDGRRPTWFSSPRAGWPSHPCGRPPSGCRCPLSPYGACRQGGAGGGNRILAAVTGTNLLVGVSSEDVARLVAAVSRHRGEVSRHPYHARLPFRMVDTVRRGGELLAGFGADAAPPFCFGELYRLSAVARGQWRGAGGVSLVCPPRQPLSLAALHPFFPESP